MLLYGGPLSQLLGVLFLNKGNCFLATPQMGFLFKCIAGLFWSVNFSRFLLLGKCKSKALSALSTLHGSRTRFCSSEASVLTTIIQNTGKTHVAWVGSPQSPLELYKLTVKQDEFTLYCSFVQFIDWYLGEKPFFSLSGVDLYLGLTSNGKRD